jgi:hypothetical protein
MRLQATTQPTWRAVLRGRARKVLRWCGLTPAGAFESDYGVSALWSYEEMRDGESLDARDCARCAFPVVWPHAPSESLPAVCAAETRKAHLTRVP